jgi:hypothetical protein
MSLVSRPLRIRDGAEIGTGGLNAPHRAGAATVLPRAGSARAGRDEGVRAKHFMKCERISVRASAAVLPSRRAYGGRADGGRS